MQIKDIINQLSPAQLRVALLISSTLLFSIATAVCGFGFRWLKNEWNESKDTLKEVNQKLDLALTNHLPHIETYTGKVVELGEKLVEGQNEANIRAAELNAYIKAKWE